MSETATQQSVRYFGALLCRHEIRYVGLLGSRSRPLAHVTRKVTLFALLCRRNSNHVHAYIGRRERQQKTMNCRLSLQVACEDSSDSFFVKFCIEGFYCPCNLEDGMLRISYCDIVPCFIADAENESENGCANSRKLQITADCVRMDCPHRIHDPYWTYIGSEQCMC